jgi:hypothetical protein
MDICPMFSLVEASSAYCLSFTDRWLSVQQRSASVEHFHVVLRARIDCVIRIEVFSLFLKVSSSCLRSRRSDYDINQAFLYNSGHLLN